MKFRILVFALLLSCSPTLFAACPTDETSSSILAKIENLNSANFQSAVTPGLASIEETRTHLFVQYRECLAAEKESSETKKFAGLNWGVGLAFMSLQDTSIRDASVIDGVVRITKQQSHSAALLLETHYLVHLKNSKKDYGTDIGIGPFVAIRLADTQGANIGAYGIGLMFGFRDPAPKTGSWNIGVGYFVDTQVKELGSGLAEGKPLPGTETSIRYKEVDKNGWLVMLSSTF